MDGRLTTLLSAQNGVCSARQALAFGIPKASLAAAVGSGELIRVRRASFVDGVAFRGSHPDARYILTVRATLAARSPSDAASHHAALALHGLPLFGFDLRRVDLVSDVSRTTTAGRVAVHPWTGRVVEAGDALATDIGTSLVQAAMASGVTAGVVCADRALATGRCSLAVLRDAAAAAQPARAHQRLRRMLDLIDPRSESVAESRARLIFVEAGLPVRPQVTMTDQQGAFVGRVDLLIGQRVVVEVDGAGKYAGDPDGLSLFHEKVREDRLRELGFVVVRVTWAELANPARLLARVHAALARAARLP